MNLQHDKLNRIFNIIHSKGDKLIIPFESLTLELNSCWISKLDKKFKIEFKILELNSWELYNLDVEHPFVNFIYNYLTNNENLYNG